ncbi:GNAT family N-acetyltransferase [Xanthobacter agilis]|uniref:GNAT family N-acetyltransferase n=1 Tax=Xanthobacter agilis TaxID=47492 RepID=UPI00372D3D77
MEIPVMDISSAEMARTPPFAEEGMGAPQDGGQDGGPDGGRDGSMVMEDAAGTRLLLSAEGEAGARAQWRGSDPDAVRALLLRALERVTAIRPAPTPLRLLGLDAADGVAPAVRDWLVAEGLAVPAGAGLDVFPGALWQRPELWLPMVRAPFPQRFALTQGRRHPVRPAKPEGVVYARHIPWLGARFELRTVDIAADLPRFHRWMNDPRVAAIWDEAGDLAKHRAYLEGLQADPHLLPLMGAVNGVPFAYFELYWAKENRIAPFYAAGDYDRGWHVLVGEDGFRGRAYVATWLPCLMHYMFLDDVRTTRIVGEPRADHHQQLRNLERSGFARVSTFEFPHKRAALVMLTRERFFGDRLWVPDGTLPQVPERAPPTAI